MISLNYTHDQHDFYMGISFYLISRTLVCLQKFERLDAMKKWQKMKKDAKEEECVKWGLRLIPQCLDLMCMQIYCANLEFSTLYPFLCYY